MRCSPKSVYGALLVIILITTITLCGCTGSPYGSPPATQGPSSGTPTVTIQNFAFSPASITVPKGNTVTWVNQDSVDHQIASDTQGFASNVISKGAGYSFKFDTPGTYAYHCSIHPSMKGTVIVT